MSSHFGIDIAICVGSGPQTRRSPTPLRRPVPPISSGSPHHLAPGLMRASLWAPARTFADYEDGGNVSAML